MAAQKQIDLTPEVSVITAISGASFTLLLSLQSTSTFSSATHTVSADVRAYRGGATPVVTNLAGSWLSPSEAQVRADAALTVQLLGKFGFAVWLTAIGDPLDRVCVMRGVLTFEAPT